MKTKTFPLTKRDHRILMHLWRWKLISSSAINFRYFDGNIAYAYKRTNILKREGFIEMVPVYQDRDFAWSITKKGFSRIRETLPELRSVMTTTGSKWHDALASAIHLGDWYMGCPEVCDYFSERQLECYYPELYPRWVPKNQDHRPDGYWLTKSFEKPKVISLELQRSAKSKKWWDEIDIFYRCAEEIDHIIWVVSSGSSIKKMALALNDGQAQIDRHLVFSLKDVIKYGWKARSLNNSSLALSIESILSPNGSKPRNLSYLARLLNFRKKPVNTDSLPDPKSLAKFA